MSRQFLGRRRMPEFDLDFTLLLISSGLMIGLMYALIALGFVLVYKATDAINFAQGEFVMFAAIIAAAAIGCKPAILARGLFCARRHDRVLLRARARGAAQAAWPASRLGDHGDDRTCVADPRRRHIGVRRRRACHRPADRRRSAVPRADHAAAGAACRRRGQPGVSRRFHLVLLEDAHGRRDARGRRQPDRVDGHGHQRAALFRAGLGD